MVAIKLLVGALPPPSGLNGEKLWASLSSSLFFIAVGQLSSRCVTATDWTGVRNEIFNRKEKIQKWVCSFEK